MIRKLSFIIILVAASMFLIGVQQPAFSQMNGDETEVMAKTTPDEFYKGKVIEVLEDEMIDVGGMEQRVQNLAIRITSGTEKGEIIQVSHGEYSTLQAGQELEVGDAVVVVKTYGFDGPASWYVVDPYRVPAMAAIAVIFIVCVLLLGRLRGATSLAGLLVTVAILILYIVPKLMEGANPVVVTLIGAVVIAVISLYVAHGFSKRTSIALLSTLLTLGLSAGLAVAFVSFARLFGLGSEEALYIQMGSTAAINLRGLLLGGIIIGALGVLDDITTAQTAAVDELRKANTALSVRELYRRALSIGREHIASLVNTLVLAYAGASLPLFLLFSTSGQPWWVVLNSADIAEEVVRTLVGSTTLVLAVPIATFFAAWFLGKRGGPKDTPGTIG